MQNSITRILAIFMAIIILQLQVKAEISVPGNTAFTPSTNSEEAEIYGSFNQINDLVSYLKANTATYSDVENYNSSLICNVSSTAVIPLKNINNGQPPILGAFWWGCLFGWAGILVVFVTTDKDQTLTNKAFSGGLVNTGVGIISFIGIIIWFLAYNDII